MDNRAIGVFDSGLGGLTAIKELRKVLPNEKLLYFGYTGRVPYGTRSAEIISKYTKQDMNFLLSQNVKMIVAACATVSSNSRDILETSIVPYTSIIRPCCETIIKTTKNGKIGIIATLATINSKAFEKNLKNENPNFEIYSEACPLLVPLVEGGFIAEDEELTIMALKRYLLPLKEKGIDTLVLGCTHYPILEKQIAKIMGENVALINSGKEIARDCAEKLHKLNLLADESEKEDEFFVSDSVQNFNAIAKICLGSEIKEKTTKIDIENY